MTLYLVATPIGNLEDITLRALRILGEVPLIAAEDTRSARHLLNHHQIGGRLTSYHEQNKRSKIPQLLAALQAGDVALISEAGTPAINDPGYELVVAAAAAGVPVVPVPGPSAFVAALIASGLPTDSFSYLGFLPRKSGDRRRLLSKISHRQETQIAYEAPHRLRESLEDLREVLGNRALAVCRELTKLHEEIFRGTIEEAINHFAAPRGEFVLVIGGASTESGDAGESLDDQIRAGLAAGDSPSHLARALADLTKAPRSMIYQRILTLQAQDGPRDETRYNPKKRPKSRVEGPTEK